MIKKLFIKIYFLILQKKKKLIIRSDEISVKTKFGTNIEKDIKSDVSSQNVIGDINISRGNQSNKIVKLKRRYAGYFKRKAINHNKELVEANRLLGYPTVYESKEREEFIKYIKFEVKVFPQKIKSFLYTIVNKIRRMNKKR